MPTPRSPDVAPPPPISGGLRPRLGERAVHPSVAVTWDRLSRQERSAHVAEMVLTGRTQAEIAAEFGCTRNAVKKLVDELEREWVLRRHAATDLHFGRQLAKLDRLEAEYWNAWRRSQVDYQRRASKSKKRPAKAMIAADGSIIPTPQSEETEASLVTEAQVGNPTFLAGIERVIDQRSKLLALYQQTLDVKIGFTLDQAFDTAAKTIEVNSARRDAFLASNRPEPLVEGDIHEAMAREDMSDEELLSLEPPIDDAELVAEAEEIGTDVAEVG